jgi:hypothetical protein
MSEDVGRRTEAVMQRLADTVSGILKGSNYEIRDQHHNQLGFAILIFPPANKDPTASNLITNVQIHELVPFLAAALDRLRGPLQ